MQQLITNMSIIGRNCEMKEIRRLLHHVHRLF